MPTSAIEQYRALCACAKTDPDPKVVAYLERSGAQQARLVTDTLLRSSEGSPSMRRLELTFEAGPRAETLRREVEDAIARYNAAANAPRRMTGGQSA